MSTRLKKGSIYKMARNQRYINGRFMAHVRECGNRFEVTEVVGDGYQPIYDMKCTGCGHRYQSTGGVIYEPVGALHSKDPNAIFQRAKKTRRSRQRRRP